MAKKVIFVTIDEDLHNDVKSAAPKRGGTIQSAYDEALRLWLSSVPGAGSYNSAPGSNPDNSPPPYVIPDTLAGLPPEDRKAIEDIAAILRHGGAFKNIILGGVEAWKEARAGSQPIQAVAAKPVATKRRRQR